jgi:hypothetical protein
MPENLPFLEFKNIHTKQKFDTIFINAVNFFHERLQHDNLLNK